MNPFKSNTLDMEIYNQIHHIIPSLQFHYSSSAVLIGSKKDWATLNSSAASQKSCETWEYHSLITHRTAKDVQQVIGAWSFREISRML